MATQKLQSSQMHEEMRDLLTKLADSEEEAKNYYTEICAVLKDE